MKKFKVLLISICIIGFTTIYGFSQYASCTPDYSVEDPEGVGVRYPVDLPVAFAGEYYSTVFTIIAPAVAATWGFDFTITKIQITDLVGLPNGLNQDSNAGNDDGYLYGGEYYCYTLDGYPIGTPGIHNVDVYANAWIRLIFEVQAPQNPQFGGTIYFTICNELSLDLGADRTITLSDHISLSANQNTNYHTYSWSNGCTTPVLSLSGNELGVGEHEISVVVTDTVGTTGKYEGRDPRCLKTDIVKITVLDENSIELKNRDRIKLYPNPAIDKIIITQAEDLINTSIEIYSINSYLIYTTSLINSETEIDLSEFDSGIYFVKLKGDKISDILKLIIE
jgi:hypothetical protein